MTYFILISKISLTLMGDAVMGAVDLRQLDMFPDGLRQLRQAVVTQFGYFLVHDFHNGGVGRWLCGVEWGKCRPCRYTVDKSKALRFISPVEALSFKSRSRRVVYVLPDGREFLVSAFRRVNRADRGGVVVV